MFFTCIVSNSKTLYLALKGVLDESHNVVREEDEEDEEEEEVGDDEEEDDEEEDDEEEDEEEGEEDEEEDVEEDEEDAFAGPFWPRPCNVLLFVDKVRHVLPLYSSDARYVRMVATRFCERHILAPYLSTAELDRRCIQVCPAPFL